MIVSRILKNVDEFHEFINEDDGNIRICRLAAPWCGPCKVLGETIKNLDKDKVGTALFAEIDIDTDETEAVGSECNIRGVPVLIYYKNGKEVKRTMGAVSADDIYNALAELS